MLADSELKICDSALIESSLSKQANFEKHGVDKRSLPHCLLNPTGRLYSFFTHIGKSTPSYQVYTTLYQMRPVASNQKTAIIISSRRLERLTALFRSSALECRAWEQTPLETRSVPKPPARPAQSRY